MLSATNIHKKYNKLEILKGVDIHIGNAEIVSIVGPSGSGKSTLLHILGTLDEADQGMLTINGLTISNASQLNLQPAGWWKRAVNGVIDLGICLGLFSGIIYLRLGVLPSQVLNLPLRWILPLAAGVWLVYYFLMELFTGRTLGKLVTQTKVIDKRDASFPNAKTIAFRSLARILPFSILESLSFFSARPNGWHDDLSNTLVVDADTPYQKRTAGFLSGNKLAAFRNSNIGFVFQFHHLLPEFSALENVCIPGWIAGKNRKAVEERATELLKILGLSNRLDNKPSQLSGGEQQRVAVARALINNPLIVMADEPTGNLDSANAKELHQLFFELRDKFKQAFLVVTHNEELAKMSDRVLQMKDGKIVSV